MSYLVDWAVDEDGELLVGPNGDVLKVTGQRQVAQEILFRLKTSKGDYTIDPNVGADLEKFIGLPNTEKVRNDILDAVIRELSRDDFVTLRNVRVLKTGDNSVLIVVEYLDATLNRIQWSASLNLNDGKIKPR